MNVNCVFSSRLFARVNPWSIPQRNRNSKPRAEGMIYGQVFGVAPGMAVTGAAKGTNSSSPRIYCHLNDSQVSRVTHQQQVNIQGATMSFYYTLAVIGSVLLVVILFLVVQFWLSLLIRNRTP